jgi:hypothetical protein
MEREGKGAAQAALVAFFEHGQPPVVVNVLRESLPEHDVKATIEGVGV